VTGATAAPHPAPPMNDPFATLGVPRRFTLSAAELEQRHRDLSRVLHPDRHVAAPPAERRAALERAVAVNDAYRTLRDPLGRAQSLLALHGVAIAEGDRAPPAVLMEVMELRESLDEARGQPARVAPLRATVAARIAAEERAIAEVFDRDATPDDAALRRARDAAVKLRYFRRFEEEADAMEE
jgi:molecular chaperone HscB